MMTRSTISSIAAALVVVATPLAVAATSHGGVSKAQALKEIETDGYTHVKDLRKQKGAWTATAREGGKAVSLRVDTLGNVRKE